MTTIVIPSGMQQVGVHQRMRLGTCEEFGCEWFLHGKEGIDEGKPFRHPAGVQCGDFARCTDPNCPCPSRLARSLQNPQRRGHLVPHVERPDPLYFHHAISRGHRLIGQSEFVDRLHEGTDMYERITTRGL